MQIYYFLAISRGLKSKMGQTGWNQGCKDYVPGGGSEGGSIPCLFQLLGAACILWLGPPSSIFKASDVISSNLSQFDFDLLPPSSIFQVSLWFHCDFKDPCDEYLDDVISSPHVEFLTSTSPAKSFCLEGTCKFQGLGHGHRAGGHYSAYPSDSPKPSL